MSMLGLEEDQGHVNQEPKTKKKNHTLWHINIDLQSHVIVIS